MDELRPSTLAIVGAFVGALAMLAFGLYALSPPVEEDLQALRVAAIDGADREWTESCLSRARRRLASTVAEGNRGVVRRRGPSAWQVLAGPALTIRPHLADAEGGGETVFFSPAAARGTSAVAFLFSPPTTTPPPSSPVAPPPPPVPPVAPPEEHPGFITHPASIVAYAAVSGVRRFQSFADAAAAVPGGRFIVAGAKNNPAFYVIDEVDQKQPSIAIVRPDAAAGTTVYERRTDA